MEIYCDAKFLFHVCPKSPHQFSKEKKNLHLLLGETREWWGTASRRGGAICRAAILTSRPAPRGPRRMASAVPRSCGAIRCRSSVLRPRATCVAPTAKMACGYARDRSVVGTNFDSPRCVTPSTPLSLPWCARHARHYYAVNGVSVFTARARWNSSQPPKPDRSTAPRRLATPTKRNGRGSLSSRCEIAVLLRHWHAIPWPNLQFIGISYYPETVSRKQTGKVEARSAIT